MSDHASPYLLTLPQLMSAKKKIGIVASSYDPKEQAFRGFDAAYVTPMQFRQQLRRNFFIELTDAELGALVFLFNNGDGKVDSAMFINEFYKLGKQEKEKFFSEHQVMRKKHEEAEKKRLEAYAARLSKLAVVPVADTWTKEEEQSAIKKMAMVAFSYDKSKGGFQAFQNAPALTPGQFRMCIRLNFQVNLTPQETGALVKLFDTDGNGEIDSKEFMYAFFMIGNDEKQAHLDKCKAIKKARQEEEANRIARQMEVYAKRVQAKIVPHTSSDMDSFRKKIKDVALCFDSGSMFNNLSKAFESDNLNPTQFKELLKFNLGVVLTPGELDAAIEVFDKDRNGLISCAEFTSMFFKLQIEEKSHLIMTKKDQTEAIHYEEEKRQRAKKIQILERTKTNVQYPCLPLDEFEKDSDDEEVGMGSTLNSSLVSSPTLNNSSNNPFLVDESVIGANSSLNTSSLRATTAPYRASSSRKSRKAPMAECLSPTSMFRSSSMLNSSGDSESFVSFFPKASQNTKDFITELEDKEKELSRLEKERRRDIVKNLNQPSDFNQSLFSLPKVKVKPSSSLTSLNDTMGSSVVSVQSKPNTLGSIKSNNQLNQTIGHTAADRPSTSHAGQHHNHSDRPSTTHANARSNVLLDNSLKELYKESHTVHHHIPNHKTIVE